jgi:hypothetical protein
VSLRVRPWEAWWSILLAGFEEQVFHLLWVHHNSEAADSEDVLSGLYDGAAVGRYSLQLLIGLNPFQLLSLALNRMQESGLLSKKDRKDAEYLAWSTVHGLALLVLEGPLHKMPMTWCQRWASGWWSWWNAASARRFNKRPTVPNLTTVISLSKTARCGELAAAAIVCVVCTHAQRSNDEQEHANNNLLHRGYSGAPPVFGRLMVVVEEPLDIGASSPPVNV